MSKKITFLLRFSVTSLLLFLCLRKINVRELPGLFQSINLNYLPYIFSLNLVFVFLGATNISILINSIKKIPFLKIIRFYSFCWCLTLISPGQLGDAALLLFFKKENIPFHNTSSIYLVDKIITLSIYLGISIFGILFFMRDLEYVLLYFLLFLLTGFLLSGCVLIILKIFQKNFNTNKFYKFIINTLRDIISLGKKQYLVVFLNFFLTLIKIMVMVLMYFMAFHAFHTDVRPLNLLFITVIASLVAYIPISLGGVGVVEFCAIYLWGSLGVNKEAVLATYALLRINNVILSFLLFLYFTIKYKGLKINDLPETLLKGIRY